MERADLAHLPSVDLLALVAWGEARGEPVEGQLAVMNVVRNRVKRAGWFGAGYGAVILKPFQFSCLNPEDPNLEKILLLADELKDALKDGDQPISQLWWLASGIVSDHLTDNVHGATHYFASSIPAPAWTKANTPVAVIGHQQFYRLT